MKKTKNTLLIVIFGLLIALPASAALPTLVPKCALSDTATPPLSCFLELAVNVSKWILGISGTLALLMFVYGGFMLMISRGNQEQIKKGKDILSKAIIGVIIIFGAYAAISFAFQALTGKGINTQFNIENSTNTNTNTSANTNTSKSGTSCACVCSDGYSETSTIKTGYNTASDVCQFECKARSVLVKGQVVTMTSCK